MWLPRHQSLDWGGRGQHPDSWHVEPQHFRERPQLDRVAELFLNGFEHPSSIRHHSDRFMAARDQLLLRRQRARRQRGLIFVRACRELYGIPYGRPLNWSSDWSRSNGRLVVS